jgi:hypothetical protein
MFFLDILFHRMSVIGILRQLSVPLFVALMSCVREAIQIQWCAKSIHTAISQIIAAAAKK